jgi:2-polyprenyl-3-methyl-5-hydroxy-6-metoxy-1,4-benzoquinol methylase
VTTLVERYDRAARTWHNQISKLGYLKAYGDLVDHAQSQFSACRHHRALRVLDAGAGTAGFALAFARAFAGPSDLCLLDPSPKMLDAARTRLFGEGIAAQCVTGDVSGLKSMSGNFDVVLCGHVIEHTTDPADSIRCLHQALAESGVLLLSVSKPHWCTRLLRLKWGHRSFDENQVAGWLRDAGFATVETFAFASGPPSRTSHGYIARKHGVPATRVLSCELPTSLAPPDRGNSQDGRTLEPYGSDVVWSRKCRR